MEPARILLRSAGTDPFKASYRAPRWSFRADHRLPNRLERVWCSGGGTPSIDPWALWRSAPARLTAIRALDTAAAAAALALGKLRAKMNASFP